MDAITPVSTMLDGSSMVPSELPVLLWAPLLLMLVGLVAWLWVLIAFQKMDRQTEPSRRASASQLDKTNTIPNPAIPQGIA